MSISLEQTRREAALVTLRKKGNPFRQQFARNSDDPVCSLYHVDSLFAEERRTIGELIERFRRVPDRPTCALPILGPRGAGKTHLLHWLKHGPAAAGQLFVTPGTFRVDVDKNASSFLEYVLYQLINVLLSGATQRGVRPLQLVGAQLSRCVLGETVGQLAEQDRLELSASSRSPWTRLGWKLGWGISDQLTSVEHFLAALGTSTQPLPELVRTAGLDPARIIETIERRSGTEGARDLVGWYRQKIAVGFLHATLLGQEALLADFLTDGFADPPGQVRPGRGPMTLALLQALTQTIVGVGIPIVVGFDQLEELLYGQTEDEIRRSSDAFFGGVVQLMSQAPGLCLLLFVEEGLWNRIVPPLPSHILDRIHEPIHLPDRGTVRNVRLSAPTFEQLTEVVRRRVDQTIGAAIDRSSLPATFPFDEAFLRDLTRRETVLRLMLQGCCQQLDELFDKSPARAAGALLSPDRPPAPAGTLPTGAEPPLSEPARACNDLVDRWHQEVRAAERRLKPVGSLAGATAELSGGLVRWLHLSKSLGVVQDDWTMAEVLDQVPVGDHPAYGTVILVQWSNPQGEARWVALGLWLGRGIGKPRDLENKLCVFADERMADGTLILLRPDDDVRLSGKSLAAWNQAQQARRHVRLEPATLEDFSKLYAFPRWLQQASEAFPDGRLPDGLLQFLAEQTASIMHKLRLSAGADDSRQAA